MKGILVGVDESSYSHAALVWAVAYGSDSKLPVTALLAWDYIGQHHIDPDAVFDPGYGSEMAENVLDQLVDRAIGPAHDVALVVECNHAGPALVKAAGDDASLIVVGARGMSGFKGLMLGSVSRYVLHSAPCPVAVIRDNAAREGEPVAVGIDGSEPSRRALRWAVEYARCRQLELIAVHAWSIPYSPYGLYAPPDLSKQAHTAEQFLAHEVAKVDASGLVKPIELRVVEGRASGVLREMSALSSLVVIGSRGHGQLTNMLLGSVSDQVSHYASSPVVVIP